MSQTAHTAISALDAMVNEPQPLGIDRPVYQHALSVLIDSDDDNERPLTGPDSVTKQAIIGLLREMAAELRDLSDSATEAGSPMPEIITLLSRWDDLSRQIDGAWQQGYVAMAHEPTLLDNL